MADERPLILALMGPTGSGKTDIACDLDPGQIEVVSCDSRQLYRELDIGTAAPDDSEVSRMPHHCVRIVDPDFVVSASFFVDEASKAVDDILSRNKTPLVVGGTGFYYTAFKTGLFDAPHDPELREKIRQMDMESKRELLARLDPYALTKGDDPDFPDPIHPNDAYRIERAIEVSELTGTAWSEHWRRKRAKKHDASPYRFIGWRLEVDREEYRQRLLLRARKMVNSGFVEEASAVYKKYGDCPGLRSLGYDFALDAAMGKISHDELPELIARSHYRYGKRQMAWFRREIELSPVVGAGEFGKIPDMIRDKLVR